METFKNPALSRENGVLTGHCVICGEYIGNEYDSDYYALIKRKYCKIHAEEYHIRAQQTGRRNYEAKRKRTKKAMRNLIEQYQKETQMQREYISELKRELDDLKRSNEK